MATCKWDWHSTLVGQVGVLVANVRENKMSKKFGWILMKSPFKVLMVEG